MVDTCLTGTSGVAVLPSGRRVYRPSGFHLLGQTEWLVDNILPKKSIGVVVADTSRFKTFFALDLALSVATGTDFLGHKTEKGPVYYFYLEDEWTLDERYAAWRVSHGTEPDELDFQVDVNRCDFLDKEAVDGFITDLRFSPEVPNPPRLVVIDTLSAMMGGDGDENGTQDMQRFMASVKRIRDEIGCSVLIVHHLNEKGRTRGSKVLRDDATMMYKVAKSNREKDEVKRLRITAEKRRAGDSFTPFYFAPAPVCIGNGKEVPVLRLDTGKQSKVSQSSPSGSDNGSVPRLTEVQQKILDYVKSGDGVVASDIANGLDMNVRQVRRGLTKLSDLMLVESREALVRGVPAAAYVAVER